MPEVNGQRQESLIQHETVFIVVEVQSGVAVGAECFTNMTAAQQRAAQVRSEHDENDDDVQVFEPTISTTLSAA
jgi:hypothetical protein